MDSNIFLTSSVHLVAKSIGKKLQAKEKGLKLLFVDTATENELEDDDTQWITDDWDALDDAGFHLKKFSITDKNPDEIRREVALTDGIYVEGGNEFYLLYHSRLCDFKKIVEETMDARKLYIGCSAGSIIAGPDIWPTYQLNEAEWVEKLEDTKGFGLVDFVVLPHWGQDHFKNLYLDYRLEHVYTTKYKLILLNDYQYVEVFGDGKYRIVDVRRDS